MSSIEQINNAIASNVSDTEHKAVAYAIAHGSRTSGVALCELVARPPDWMADCCIPAIREALQGVVTVESYAGCYVFGGRTPEDKPSASVEMAEKVAYVPHWFVFPWPGAVELHTVVGVETSQGQLVLQLRRGGYQRGPKREDADEVAYAVIEELTKLDGVRVTVYGT